MEWKDYAIIGLAILVVVGPVGVHFYKKGRGPATRNPQGETFIDDNRRLGTMVSLVGGRTLQEGAKLKKMGALRYANDQAGNEQKKVGGA